jgi:short-subunit dehydrogenase
MTNVSASLTVLITGASSGIGYELASRYLAMGARVIVLARTATALAALVDKYPFSCIAIPVDLTNTGESQCAGETIKAHTSHIDIAILNAGTCEYVDIANLSLEPFDKVMAINWQGVLNCLMFCLPLLRNADSSQQVQQRRRAQLVGISSMASVLPMPRSQAYGASKVALEYLFNSMRVDMAYDAIDITLVRPGFVKTPLTERNDFAMPFAITAATAAEKILYGVGKRKWLVQFPWPLVVVMQTLSLLPLKIQIAVLKKLSRHSP